MDCEGCQEPIFEGEHFVELDVRTSTVMPRGLDLLRTVKDEGQLISLHNPLAKPECFHLWARRNDIMLDVFGR